MACMHVCMFACMHACMHACMYACMHVAAVEIVEFQGLEHSLRTRQIGTNGLLKTTCVLEVVNFHCKTECSRQKSLNSRG